MESQRQNIPRVSANTPIVLGHIVEQSVLIAQMVICLHFRVDAPLIRHIGLLGTLAEYIKLCFSLVLHQLTCGFLISWRLCLRNRYLELFQNLEVILPFPLREDEIVLFEIFSKQSVRLTRLYYRLAVFVHYCL